MRPGRQREYGLRTCAVLVAGFFALMYAFQFYVIQKRSGPLKALITSLHEQLTPLQAQMDCRIPYYFLTGQVGEDDVQEGLSVFRFIKYALAPCRLMNYAPMSSDRLPAPGRKVYALVHRTHRDYDACLRRGAVLSGDLALCKPPR